MGKTCTCTHPRPNTNSPHSAPCPKWRKRLPDTRTQADRVAADPDHVAKKMRRACYIPHDGLLKQIELVKREGCYDEAEAVIAELLAHKQSPPRQ